MKCFGLLLVALISGLQLKSQKAGDLDEDFGVGGETYHSYYSQSSASHDMAILSDNTILLPFISYAHSSTRQFVVAFDSEGQLKKMFADEGKILLRVLPQNSLSISSQMQIASGVHDEIYVCAQDTDLIFWYIASLNTDGSINKQFGTDGFVRILANGSIPNLTVSWNGKINYTIQGGYAGYYQLNSDGSPDLSFGNNGRLDLTPLSLYYHGPPMIYDDSTLLMLASWTSTQLSQLIRIKHNGTLDTTFGNAGIVQLPAGITDQSLHAIACNQGKIYVCGMAWDTVTQTETLVLRYNSNGVLDNTFDGDGSRHLKLAESFSSGVRLAFQPDDKMLLCFEYRPDFNNPTGISVVRLMPDGSTDNTFGDNGRTDYFNEKNYDWEIGKAMLQHNGKILVSGTVNRSDIFYKPYPGAMRFHSGLYASILERGSSKISIYPNPTSGKVKIEFNEVVDGMLTINDVAGRLVDSYAIRNEVSRELVISGAPGLYFVSLTTKDKRYFSGKVLRIE